MERTGTVTATDEDHEGPACGMAELVEQTVRWAGRVDMWVPPFFSDGSGPVLDEGPTSFFPMHSPVLTSFRKAVW